MITRIIPSTGEAIPVIGLGTWQSFDVPKSDYSKLHSVLTTMYESGGRLIDSSPMYGSSEQVIGDLTSNIKLPSPFFYATKVWTTGLREGIRQMESSMKKMKRDTMDLMQIHNLTDWKTHLPQLKRWKEEGKIRYIGITHYTDSSHAELERILKTEQLDFVQFNFSIFSRNAEASLLPAAAERGVATLINRPFGEGSAFKQIKGKSLPEWAKDFGANSWASFFLKYIISHPHVSCVIPATGDPKHALDNFSAGSGELPDADKRSKMVQYIKSL
jgi:diketogulonate reductase-like aldo/keto reductase